MFVSQQTSVPRQIEAEEPELCSDVENTTPASNDTLSVIIRFHNVERLNFLEEALFSLAIQSWRDQETVLVIQNGVEETKKDIIDVINRLPWPAPPRYQVISVAVPDGVDGRATLLNRGIEQATGRYLAFLDDDDVIYHHGYTALIHQLKNCEAAIAVGGCRMARLNQVSNHWYVSKKENPFAWGRDRFDLLVDNFIPIHSYVVDRLRVEPQDLFFDEIMPPLEDYDFLLRLCTKYEFDFSKLDTPVAEYRIHGQNSLAYDPNVPSRRRDSHLRAQKLIGERKKDLQCLVPAVELISLRSELAARQAELATMRHELAELQSEPVTQDRFLFRVALGAYSLLSRYPKLERQLNFFTGRPSVNGARALSAKSVPRTRKQLKAIIRNVKRWKAAGHSYDDLNLKRATADGLFPKEMVGPEGIRHLFDGTVNIGPAPASDGPSDTFYVLFSGVPNEGCAKLAYPPNDDFIVYGGHYRKTASSEIEAEALCTTGNIWFVAK